MAENKIRKMQPGKMEDSDLEGVSGGVLCNISANYNSAEKGDVVIWNNTLMSKSEYESNKNNFGNIKTKGTIELDVDGYSNLIFMQLTDMGKTDTDSCRLYKF